MKKALTILLLLNMQLYSQDDCMNIMYNTTPEYKYAELSDISEITFNAAGTEMIVTLTDASSTNNALSTIVEMTFDATGNGVPLPVELTSFTTNINGNSVLLNWTTATEVNNYGFDVERASTPLSMSGTSSTNDTFIPSGVEGWQKIGFLKGYGNSSSPKNYSFSDAPTGGTSFNYRLKQIDIDGKSEYSEILTVKLGVPDKFELSQNYPNPFNPATKITYCLPKEGFVTMKVYDILGEEVISLINENIKAGNHTVSFDGNNLASGMYFTRLNSGNYNGLIKMILVK